MENAKYQTKVKWYNIMKQIEKIIRKYHKIIIFLSVLHYEIKVKNNMTSSDIKK